MRKSIALLICGLIIASVSLNAADKRLTIAVIPKGTTHEFWKTVHAGALKAAKELDVDIIWKGPLKEDDREEQIKVVEDMIARGVDGIVLAPLDDTALRAPVANAKRAGISTVIFDSDLKGPDFISFVATDNEKGGYLGGKQLCKLLGGQGRVIMLRYQEGSASTSNREKGFLDAVEENNNSIRSQSTLPTTGIKLISINQYGGATTESAYKASENMLARLKTDAGKLAVEGIFCPNESTTFGMLRALQDSGFAGKVRFVGFDASSKLITGLKNGQIDALVIQNPARMGYLGVKTMVDHLNHKAALRLAETGVTLSTKAVERRVDTGVALVTKENMDKPEIKEVLEPDLSLLK